MNLLPPDAAVRRRRAPRCRIVLTNDRASVRLRHRPGRARRHPRRPLGLDRCAGPGRAPCRSRSSPSAAGLHQVPPLTAETRFPLGTFRVWTVWRPAAQVLVYPAPEPFPPPLPPGEPRAGGAATARRAEHRRIRRRARLPARRPAEAGGLEKSRQGRRTGQPRHAAGAAP